MDPKQFAGHRVERDDRASRPGSRVERSADHQRRAFELELGARPKMIRLERPRELQLAEVGRIDLIQGRVPRVPEIGSIGWPFAFLRRRLNRRLAKA